MFGYTFQLVAVYELALINDNKVIKQLGACLEEMKFCDLKKIDRMDKEYKAGRDYLTSEQKQIQGQIEKLSK